ncbi:polyprenyl synthetase family protein, partial [Guyparkeria sp. 1SP6A2]|nr:polyprenyl synthetase family protein [Guyparkeria sp. 1SP6A2]
MVAGQALDLAAVGGHPDVEALAHMHAHKTGALIVAAVRMGGLIAVEADDPRLAALIRYARAIGLAFQIHDDILDVTGDTATLGKTSGADAARDVRIGEAARFLERQACDYPARAGVAEGERRHAHDDAANGAAHAVTHQRL